MTGIKGKVIAITGAGSGIGEATALLLAERGAQVVLGSRRPERLAALAVRITAAGGEAAHTPTDVTRREDLAGLVALARERFGRLDVLVANAGIGPVSALDDLRVDDWDAMIDVNLKGVLYGIAAALPVFRQQGYGQFVNVASTAAYRTVPDQSVYSATKVAVRALSEGLRQEAGDSVRVSIVSPGFIRTGFTDSVPDAEVRARLTASKEKFAIAPDAIARAIAFAVEQPADVDVNEIVVRPTAQG
ncbi:SDR family oxidoreductase [Streptomyces sp. SL13]|uniref:SDR family oxidoreductase n=1 Tax=Streptantibioticus silvisoli TaxID=2705255 RepID=A0AA90KHY0_9ACTN